MAQGFRLHRTPRRNPPPSDFIEDELAGAPPGAPTKNSGSLLTSLVSSCAPTPDHAPAPPAPTLSVTTPAPAPTEDLFRQFMKA